MKETTAPLPGLCPLLLSFTKHNKATQHKRNNLSKTLAVYIHACGCLAWRQLSRHSTLFCTVQFCSFHWEYGPWITLTLWDIFELRLKSVSFICGFSLCLLFYDICIKHSKLKEPSSKEEVSMQHTYTSTNKKTLSPLSHSSSDSKSVSDCTLA